MELWPNPNRERLIMHTDDLNELEVKCWEALTEYNKACRQFGRDSQEAQKAGKTYEELLHKVRWGQ